MNKILSKKVVRENSETILFLDGEMDFNGARDLKAELDEMAREFKGVMTVILDLEKVTYVASDGLGFLISLQKRLARDNVGLRIRNPQPVVRELFAITKMDHVIPISSELGGEEK